MIWSMNDESTTGRQNIGRRGTMIGHTAQATLVQSRMAAQETTSRLKDELRKASVTKPIEVIGIATEIVNVTESASVSVRDTATITTRTMSVIASAKAEGSHVATDGTKYQDSPLSSTCEDVSQGSVLLQLQRLLMAVPRNRSRNQSWSPIPSLVLSRI